MTCNGVRASVRFVFSLALILTAVVVTILAAVGPGAAAMSRSPLTEADGLHVAETALAYATVTYVVDDEERQGMPFLLGGRSNLDTFNAAMAGGDLSAGDLEGIGLDASGLVVAVLRDVNPGVRFAASAGDDPVLWADATSALLFDYNVIHVEAEEVRAGDLIFFGRNASVTGVAVVSGQTGTRVDFVVASAGQGRVHHTFARTDGDYWQNNIVGVGRLSLPAWNSK